jgi:hypothetical protein
VKNNSSPLNIITFLEYDNFMSAKYQKTCHKINDLQTIPTNAIATSNVTKLTLMNFKSVIILAPETVVGTSGLLNYSLG